MSDHMPWLQEVEFIKADQQNIVAQYEQVGELASLPNLLLCEVAEYIQ